MTKAAIPTVRTENPALNLALDAIKQNLDAVSELIRSVPEADLLVLPSYFEARPTVIYEAMAAGTPVLASNVGGIPEMVVDGETGVLVPPREPASMPSPRPLLWPPASGVRQGWRSVAPARTRTTSSSR